MKSTIKIDYNKNGHFIRIEYCPSDDLRDKALKNFMEEFDYASNLCVLEYISHREDGSQTLTLSPIPAGKLQERVNNTTCSICPAQIIEMTKIKLPEWYREGTDTDDKGNIKTTP